ncbi:helix-turn-helix transcriptional regulator [Actinospongicola halichondriae]|uniref:helix-turn-helix transcriptional regulator n=1 Tax=Actinospongicola halichondriae TaxID=3236844 RepID=UPI003D4368D7
MRTGELGAFLRSRRARLEPTDFGFPTGRRRGVGLRREELASLAGVTVSWLAKLEQGRAQAVSADVLDAIGRALRLDDTERGHLFGLAGFQPADVDAGPVAVTAELRALVERLHPSPAYLLDRAWNMVAWNEAEAALFPSLHRHRDEPPHLLDLVFCDDDLAQLMADHDEELVRLVAQFRLHRAAWPNDPAIEAVVDRLTETSSRFTQLWTAGDVASFTTTRRLFDHPVAGRLELDHHRLAVLDQPGMQLVVYTAADQADLENRLRL